MTLPQALAVQQCAAADWLKIAAFIMCCVQFPFHKLMGGCLLHEKEKGRTREAFPAIHICHTVSGNLLQLSALSRRAGLDDLCSVVSPNPDFSRETRGGKGRAALGVSEAR